MSWRLDGKRLLITGASRGIGAAIAASAADRGAALWLVARGADDLQELAGSLQRDHPGREIHCTTADVSDTAQRLQLMEEVAGRWEALDGLINNAGNNLRRRAVEFSLDDYRRLMDTNLTSCFHLCQLTWPLLGRADAASVVNVASVAGLCHLRTGAVYAMSKAAMIQLTRNLAVEWAPDGIRVNAIAPWYTETPLAKEVLSEPDYLNEVLRRTPAGRIASAQEVADVAVFLCLPAAGYVTGVCLPVDGGMTVYGF